MSTFSRWRKVELLDLAEKLKMAELGNNVRKNELIAQIENHLGLLDEPLDVDVEYPELKSFYDSMVKEESELDSETESQEEEEEEEEADNELPYESVVDVVLGPDDGIEVEGDSEEEQEDGENVYEEDGEEEAEEQDEFRFDFQNYLYDIKENVSSINESVQDFLSTTRTVDTIFGSIELYYITKPLIASQNRELSLSTLLTWVLVSFLLPLLSGYYINFCRYDFTIKIDPMIYYLTKSLLSFAILNLRFPLPRALTDLPLASYIELGLQCWQVSLGQLPLVFAIVGVILTLYII